MIILLQGPAGSGKTTITKKLMNSEKLSDWFFIRFNHIGNDSGLNKTLSKYKEFFASGEKVCLIIECQDDVKYPRINARRGFMHFTLPPPIQKPFVAREQMFDYQKQISKSIIKLLCTKSCFQ